MPPRGHYLAREAGRLAGVTGNTIGQWARNEYIRSSVSSGTPRIYAFQDVAEAMVVHVLREHRVRYATIKRAIVWLREEAGGDWPLTSARVSVFRRGFDDTPTGRSRLVIHTRFGLVEVDQHARVSDEPDSLVFDADFLDNVRSDLSRGGWAARQLPDLRYIEVNPARLSGRPVVTGTRVSAEFAARLAGTPGGVTVLRQEYDLRDDEINDAVRWWRAVCAYEAA
jgi:uncharacterized protein (DUF433 family)/DNA-binding transcriptional MerR regulator